MNNTEPAPPMGLTGPTINLTRRPDSAEPARTLWHNQQWVPSQGLQHRRATDNHNNILCDSEQQLRRTDSCTPDWRQGNGPAPGANTTRADIVGDYLGDRRAPDHHNNILCDSEQQLRRTDSCTPDWRQGNCPAPGANTTWACPHGAGTQRGTVPQGRPQNTMDNGLATRQTPGPGHGLLQRWPTKQIGPRIR